MSELDANRDVAYDYRLMDAARKLEDHLKRVATTHDVKECDVLAALWELRFEGHPTYGPEEPPEAPGFGRWVIETLRDAADKDRKRRS